MHAGLQEARGSPVLKGSLIAYKDDVDDDGGTTTTAATAAIVRVTFQLTNATAGEPVDLSPRITKASPVDACDAEGEPGAGEFCYGGNTYTASTTNVAIINYRDETQRLTDIHWDVQWLGVCQESPCDDLLEVNETALITVWFHTQRDVDASATTTLEYVQETEGGDTDGVHLNGLLLKKTQFIIEVVPPVGGVLLIERITPALLDSVMNLN